METKVHLFVIADLVRLREGFEEHAETCQRHVNACEARLDAKAARSWGERLAVWRMAARELTQFMNQ